MGYKFNPLIFSGLDLSGGSSFAIGTPINGADPNAVLTTDGAGNLSDKVLNSGQILIGSTGAAPVVATLTGTTNRVTVTSAAGSITLSLPQDIGTSSNVTFGSVALQPSGSLDTTSVGTLAIGTANASIINIGNSGSTVNIQGTVLYENVTQLQVKDPLITLNKGAGAGSASGSGVEIEEAGSITAFSKTSADRLSYTFKAPATAGIAIITPGAGGITLNQSSHNPVTVTTVGSTPNTSGISLSTQALTLQPADATNPGVITALAQTLGGKKTFSNGVVSSVANIDNLYDVANTRAIDLPNRLLLDASEVVAVDFYSRHLNDTLGTTIVNWAGPGVVVSSNISATNLSGTNTGDQTITLTGDVTGSGTGSFPATLKTVNATVGTFGSASTVNTIIVNAKGLVTSVTNSAIQIAESQVTGLVSDLAAKLTAVSVSTANGFAGTSSGTSTPALTISTTVTGLVKGNGTSISAAVAGTDYQAAGNYALAVTGDVTPGSFSGLINNTTNQSITGLSFATSVSTFEALLNIQISATTNTFTTVSIFGTRKASGTWAGADITSTVRADMITGLSFGITAAGVVTISVGSITGFTSGIIKYRALSLS